MLESLHEADPRMSRIKSLLRLYLWWVKISEDIEKDVSMNFRFLFEMG